MKIPYYLLLFFIFACNISPNTTTNEQIETEQLTQKDSLQPTIKRDISKKTTQSNYVFNDYKFEIQEKSNSLQIAAQNPNGQAINQLEIPLEGKLKETQVMDMNQDGRPEFVVILNTAKGEKVQVYSFTPKSYLPVYISDYEAADYKETNYYYIDNEQLVSVYTTQKGIQKSIGYNLVAGEAGYRLEAHGMTPREMEQQVYGAFVTEVYPNKSRQKLVISDNGLGEIVVKINSNHTEKKQANCEFEAIGILRNGEIKVPLGNVRKGMTGTMILTKIDNGWTISTTKLEDQSALMSFCSSDASLAGDYTRLKK